MELIQWQTVAAMKRLLLLLFLAGCKTDMPRPLETYTASGRVRGGPVAAGVPAGVLTQQAEAAAQLGGAIVGAGRDASQIAAIMAQRQKENDFNAVNDAKIVLTDSLIKWENDPENRGREDIGQAYREYADKQVVEVSKTLPNARAGELFRRSVMPSIQADWEKNLKLGEQTRFENYKAGQIAGSIAENQEYQNRTNLDPNLTDAAAELRSQQLTSRIASIQTVYGKTMPLQAAAMAERAVVDAVIGTMEFDTALARGLLDKHQVVDPETRQVLLTRIERVEENAKSTATFNDLKAIENSVALGYETLTPVPTPHPAILAGMSDNQRQKVEFDLKVANGTISAFKEIRGWNWQEQQKIISAIDIKDNPAAGEVKANLVKMLSKSQEQQTGNPAGWQMANDPEFQTMNQRINALPIEQRTQARMQELGRMIALQGAPPIGTPEAQAKRYLNLPTGMQNVLSVDEAKTRAQTFNNVPPNQLTKMVEDFNAEFPDPKLAAMAWNDMQNLPAGEGKLKMGIRVAAAINDPSVRNNFIGAMSNKDPLKTEDKKSTFADELDGNETYRRFVSGWIGDGNQRGDELTEFRDSVTRYAMFLSSGENLKTDKAIDKAVQRTISDNYILVSVNGSEVPIYRFDRGGRELFSDKDAEPIQAGIAASIQAINVDAIATDSFHFPLAPRLPGDKTEANNYLRRLIQSTGTLVVEPDGMTATVYLKGEGENDFPFQLRGVDGLPFTWSLETMKIIGQGLLSPVPAQDAYRQSLERLLGRPPTMLELKGGPATTR